MTSHPMSAAERAQLAMMLEVCGIPETRERGPVP